MLRRALILALVLAVPVAAGKKAKTAPLVRLPEQKVELLDLKLATPAQRCTNYAWAVAVEAMLSAQDVVLDQHFWVQKANGGELCIESVPALDALAAVVDGTYVMADGRKVRLETCITSGAPMPDDAVIPLRRQHPVLLFWRARAYVLRAVVYDEYIYPNGQRMFQIREMKLLDPLLRGKAAEVEFVTGRDDPGEIGGVVSIEAVPITPTSWQR